MDIFSLSADDWKNGKGETLIPEFYALGGVIENNPWHKNQNVFDHCIHVLSSLEELFAYRDFSEADRRRLQKHEEKKVGKYTHKHILWLSTLLHDIRKDKTVVKNTDGTTVSIGHELLGAPIAEKIVFRLRMDSSVTPAIRFMVANHGLPHEMINRVLTNPTEEEIWFELFKESMNEWSVDLMIHAYADMMGSDLSVIDSEYFQKRKKKIIEWIVRLI